MAEDGGAVVGFAAMSVMHLLERDRPLCRLTALMTSNVFRGKGVGRQLVERVEREARKLDCDRLEVTSAAQRDEANAFYGQLGFKEQPRRFVKSLTE